MSARTIPAGATASVFNKQIGDEFYLERRSLIVFQLSLLYLAAPAFLYLFTFATPAAGYSIAFILAVSMLLSVRGAGSTDDLRLYLLALLPAIGIAWLAGFPSGPFAWDWIKHWALINTLADNEWPVAIQLDGGMAYLRFYVAAYLPPAAAHKLAPALPVWAMTAAWFVAGFVLVFRMVSVPLTNRGGLACLAGMLAFLLFAGADFFAENLYRLMNGRVLHEWFGLHYEMWFENATSQPMQYSSMLAALLWVPHQSIATFLVAAMVILDRSPRSMQQSLLAFGLLALWSPYGMIGLLPLIAVRFMRQESRLFTPHVMIAAVGGGAFALLIAAYLSTDMPGSSICLNCAVYRLALPLDFFGFFVVELGAFGLILRTKMFTDALCLASTVLLLLIPFFGGDTPDFVMRTSMGPLFVLTIRSVETLATWRVQGIGTCALWVVALALCVPTNVSEAIYHFENGRAHTRLRQDDSLSQQWYHVFAASPHINAQQFFEICGWKYLPQYFTRQTPPGVRDEARP